MTAFSFDATQVAPDTGRLGAVPAGYYKVVVDKAELKPTKSGTGQAINTQFGILEGAFKGQKIFHMFNVKNDSPKAQEIAHAQFSALLHAINILKLEQLEQMQNIPFFVKVKIEKSEGYEDKNVITAFRGINDSAALAAYNPAGAAPAQASRPVAPPPPPVAAPGAAPGWQAPANAQPWQQAPNAAPAAPTFQAPPVAQASAPVAPVQQATIAPSPEQPSAPTPSGEVMSPWMQQQATA